MIVNIEQEYSNHIADGWQKFSDITRDIFKLHRNPERTYNAISLLSIEFLQDKLKSLEAQETSSPTTCSMAAVINCS